MPDRKLSAVLSGLAVVYFAYSIYGATEAPSQMLAMTQWLFLAVAVITFGVTIYKVMKGE
jgi:hypothetical protein